LGEVAAGLFGFSISSLGARRAITLREFAAEIIEHDSAIVH
jgi:hypothetical protein